MALQRVVDLGELLEDALLVFGIDPDAGIGDAERDRLPILPQRG
jgi:hypothetical protein